MVEQDQAGTICNGVEESWLKRINDRYNGTLFAQVVKSLGAADCINRAGNRYCCFGDFSIRTEAGTGGGGSYIGSIAGGRNEG